MRRSTRTWLSFCIQRLRSSLVSADSQFLKGKEPKGLGMPVFLCLYLVLPKNVKMIIHGTLNSILSIYSLCNAEGVSALADKSLSVIFPLRSDSYQLKSIGTGTELPVGRFNLMICAVSQVYPAQRMLKVKFISQEFCSQV